MGYVPLFDTLTTGTLYGKWPDIGLWPVLLSMADRFGRIDVTPQYIAGVTGLEIHEVIACLDRFCSPDPDSRSRTEEDQGRRLERLDPDRQWGWKVVNHAKYRERARLLAKDSERTATGMDAERKRRQRERPPKSPEIPLSDGDGDGDKKLRSTSSELLSSSSSDRANGQDVLQKRRIRKQSLDTAVAALADSKAMQ